MKRALIWVFVILFLPLGGFTVNASRTNLPPPQNINEASLDPTSEEFTPPEACGVPQSGPFGKDVEVFRGGDGVYRYDYSPAWKAPANIVSPCSTAEMRPSVAAAAINSELVVAVWEEIGSPLKYNTWSGSWATTPGSLPYFPEDVTAPGSPILVSPSGASWEVYLRGELDGEGRIYLSTTENGTTTNWTVLQGVEEDASAASDPAVVVTGVQHKLVFYRDNQGVIRFTEYQSGVWRSAPVALPEREKKLLLPLVVKMNTTSSASPEPEAWSDLNANEQATAASPSELSAISRNENHVAVFFVDENNRLWVNEWSNHNRSDWSDTEWVMLMENVSIEKPAVTSRHINHVAVAVRDTGGMPYIIEWTQNLNDTGEPGWDEPYTLGKILDGPLAIASRSLDSLTIFGTDTDGIVWQLDWFEDDGWSEWTTIGLGIEGEAASRTMTAVVRRQGDIMLFYRDEQHCAAYSHYSSLGVTPIETSIDFSEETQGYPLGQTTAWVEGNTLWVTAHADDLVSPVFWQVDAFLLGAEDQSIELVLGEHLYLEDMLVVMEAADLDEDGDQEVVLATGYSSDGTNTKIMVSVLDFEISPALNITILETIEILTDRDSPLSFSLALSDLDGTGVKNELVVAIKSLYDWNGILLQVYQYDGVSQTLTLKADTTLDLVLNYGMSNYFGSQIQVGTGNLYPGYPGQQIVVSDLDVYYWSTDNNIWVFPTVRTYYVDTSLSKWEIEAVDEDLITYENGWMALAKPDSYYGILSLEQILGFYTSALDTGDLNADGTDEVALAYSNQILSVDPGAGDFPFQIVPFDNTWFSNAGPDRSIEVGDVDLDGRAEILSEMYMEFYPDYSPKLSLFEIMGSGTLQRSNTFDLQKLNNSGSLHAILVDDIDNDSFISRLTGCADYGEVRIVAVLNGAPRWYAGGVPINVSGGTYSYIGESTTGFEYGTQFNLGASISLGMKETINVPVIALEAGELRASVTTDIMSSQGISQSTEVYESWSVGLGFENTGLGIVVYEVMPFTCFFYDVYHPAAPEDTSRAMACIPTAQDSTGTIFLGLEDWRDIDFQTAKGLSWADVGHRTPAGAYSNDLSIAGNYKPVLPVDEFMLVHEWPPLLIRNSTEPGLFQWWTYDAGTSGALTQFNELEVNTTVSAGADVFGATFDAGVTAGVGFNSSQTMSWGNSLAFEGVIEQFQDPSRLCYTIHPYVYLAKATTVAGVTYPYWEMDFYVTEIGIGCDVKSTANP